jgi:cytochrome P450
MAFPCGHCADSRFGPYWSVTRYKDIMQVDVDWQTFSSDYTMGGIQIRDAPKENVTVNFIRMDPPRHDAQRKTVSPIVAPANLVEMEALIRERTREVLDGLPRGEVFDWVPRVSVELTTRMLATLFDFPFEDRHLLPYWSDAATADLESGGPSTPRRSASRSCCRARRTSSGCSTSGPCSRRATTWCRCWRTARPHGTCRRGIHGQRVPADRRRQRHDAQFDVGRRCTR